MSKLSKFFHEVVEGLDLDPQTKSVLHKWGMYGVWAVMVGGGLVVAGLLFSGC